MTRFDDSNRRASLCGRDRAVSISHRRKICRRACCLALNVALGVVAASSTDPVHAQYQTTAQTSQYQRAQAPLATQRPTHDRNAATSSIHTSPTPFLSGLLNLNKQPSPSSAPSQRAQPQASAQQSRLFQQSRPSSAQESQRLGVFGTKPLFSGLKPNAQTQQRQSQEFHAVNRDHAPSAGALAQASSNPAEANEAIAKVPWELFPAQTRERFQKVAAAPTMYRRLPMAGGRCNPELFDYFLSYPQTIVELWNQMGYDDVEMKQLGPATYAIKEKGGSSGKLTILYQSSEVAVAHVVGVYRGAWLMRPVEGEAFLILQTRYTENQELTPLVVCRLDAFVDVKNYGADLVARAFTSMIGKIADANFEQTLAFIDSVCQTAEQNPRQFQDVVANLSGLSPEARRILAGKAATVALQAQQRRGGQRVDYRLLAKANAPNPGYARILSRGANSAVGQDATYAVDSRMKGRSDFHGYGVGSKEEEFFDANDRNPGFATSRRPSSHANTFGTSQDWNVGVSDDFTLANDDGSDEMFEYDEGEPMITGEEFLASQPGSSLTFGVESSLAKIEVKPSRNSRAMKLLNEQESTLDAGSATTLSTDDDDAFIIDDELPVEESAMITESDEEEFAIESFELLDEENAPVAIPLSIASQTPKPSTRLPSSLRATTLPNAVNAARLVEEDEKEGVAVAESDDVAEISIDENGNPVLDFYDAPEESEDEEALASPTHDADAQENGDAPNVAEPATSYAEEAVDEFNGDGWTRSVLANNVVGAKTPNAKKTKTTATPKAEATEERKRPVTRRYAPSDVKALQDEQKAPEDGERVASYRWSPVPDAFVIKTAAIDKDEDSRGSKSAKFTKPEVR